MTMEELRRLADEHFAKAVKWQNSVIHYEDEALAESRRRLRHLTGTAADGLILQDAVGLLDKNPWYARAKANRTSHMNQATMYATMAMLKNIP